MSLSVDSADGVCNCNCIAHVCGKCKELAEQCDLFSMVAILSGAWKVRPARDLLSIYVVKVCAEDFWPHSR